MKQRTPGYIFTIATMILVVMIFMVITPQDFLAKNGLKGAPYNFYMQMKNILSYWVVWVILGIAFLMTLIGNKINQVIEHKRFAQLTAEEKASYLEEKKVSFWKRWLKSSAEKQSDEEEKEILLDHGFDGIMELDNSLPQWWLAMFWLGTIFMVVYVAAYFTTDFAHPEAEYAFETAELEREFTIWKDQNDITIDQAKNFYQDEGSLARGEEIFNNICATCHTTAPAKNGSGGTGPNLTDAYWVNQLQDSLYYNIYNMVYDGSPNNPVMQAFGQTKQLSGLDIQDVASYVYHLNQVEKPITQKEGGLAPQGDFVSKWAGPGREQSGAAATSETEDNAAESTPETEVKQEIDSSATQVTADSIQ